MKTQLLLFSVLLTSALGREIAESKTSCPACCPLSDSALHASAPTPPTAPSPTNPTPKPTGKERGKRPTLPAHLFM